MELKVVKNDEKTLILEVKNEKVGFTNLIRKELWNDNAVSEAAQIKEHPYLAEPKIFVKVSRGKPVNVLKKASDRIVIQLDEFKEKFKAALKE